MNHGRVPALDGVRGVAIGLVLLSHWMYQPWAPHALAPWLTLGAWGVQIFFVLSGYLITSLLVQEWQSTGRVSLWGFYIRRVSRIMPAFYVFVAVMGVLGLYGVVDAPAGSVPATAFYTGDYVNVAPTVFGHTWSLAVEEQFYLLWPALLILAGPRRAAWVAAAVLIACPISRLISLGWTPGSLVAAAPYRFDTQADALAVGCLAALAHDRLAAWIDRSMGIRACVALVPLLLLAVAEAHTIPGPGALVFSTTLGPLLVDVGVALVIVSCVSQPGNLYARCLAWRPLAAIGIISYSLYLWQQAMWQAGPVLSLALAFGAALASYFVVEKPIRRIGRAYARRVTATVSGTALPVTAPSLALEQ